MVWHVPVTVDGAPPRARDRPLPAAHHGTFTVNKVEFDGPGALRTFEVTFEQHCEEMPPALRGTWTFAAA